MFDSYTEIDIRVLIELDNNDKGLHGHSKKMCKDLTRILGNIFLKSSHWQMEQFGPVHCWCTQPKLFQK